MRQKNRTPGYVLLILLLALAFNGARAQTAEDPVAKQIDALFSGYNSTTPGVAVAVVKDGKVIFKKGYGTANLEYDIPVTTKTVFHVASVSKQFTAFSIYLLEKQRKISLEDDVRKFIPEVPKTEKPIRVRHLMGHMSGLRDQWALLTLAGWRLDDVITSEQILKMIARQNGLNFEPGSAFSYSNSGYSLLAEIVARASGKSFADFTQENIFKPLGMADSLFYDDFEKIVRNRAYSYEKDNGVYEKRNLNYSNVGATSLFTTAEDLAKWAMNLENPVVGDAEMVRRFNEPSLLNSGQPVLYATIDGEPNYYGKGQIARNYRGVDLYNHTGHDAGFRSYLVRVPAERLSVILLSNDEHILNFRKGMTITEFYLKDKLKPALTTAAQSPPPVSGKPAWRGHTPDELKELEGIYQSDELATDYTFTVRDGKLVMTHNRLSDSELTEVNKDKFSGKVTFPVEFEFTRNNKGVITGLNISNWGAKNIRFEKVRLPD